MPVGMLLVGRVEMKNGSKKNAAANGYGVLFCNVTEKPTVKLGNPECVWSAVRQDRVCR
jgi:hypothetical protein